TLELGNLEITEVDHLPIIKEYAKKINLVETINQIVPSEMDISPGDIVLSLVVDTLSGRSPLYRLSQFYEDVDTEILFGKEINPSLLSDHNLARGMDKIFDAGTQKVFSQISLNAVNTFDVNTSGLHYDTTSVSVYGDYDNPGEPFKITYGYSKAKRPDLKQFLISMLCVDKNIPIMGSLEDG
ncbi:MAG: IS1634 family transposase, partial [Alphaproteobacteria bacterium]|nr:IS1634 family transposase [Alphaproteobacteria bacterium]